MKQYTNKDQTAKLIELGFPKPKFSFPIEDNEYPDYVDEDDIPWSIVESYSIGELIEFLPRWIKPRGGLEIVAESDGWLVMHGHDPFDPQCTKPELIDTLFEYCVKLKEEGVI